MISISHLSNPNPTHAQVLGIWLTISDISQISLDAVMGSGAWSVIGTKICVVSEVQFIIFKRMNHYLLHKRKIDTLLASFNYGPVSTLFSIKSPNNSRGRYSLIPILQMRKLRHRKINFCFYVIQPMNGEDKKSNLCLKFQFPCS